MQVNTREFFSNYMFNAFAEELTTAERCKALTMSIFLGVATLGLCHFFCLGLLNKKKCSIIDKVNTLDKADQMKFYLPRAEKGNAFAQVKMAKLDKEKKINWYAKAAHKNHPLAMYKVFRFLDKQGGAEFDSISKAEWCKKAAEKGNAKAQYAMGLKAEKEAEIFKWTMMAAKQGLPNAEYKVATMFQEGKGVDKLQNEANVWFKKAALHDHIDGQLETAKILNFGIGTKENDVQAMHFYKLAADQGDVKSMLILGSWYLKKDGDKIAQRKNAEPWFKLAMAQGSPEAAYNLGTMYIDGNGVDKDNGKAFDCFLMAAEGGIKQAMLNVSKMYKEGIGIDGDDGLAAQWANAAALQPVFN